MDPPETTTRLAPPTLAFFWGAFAISWVLLGVLPLAPSFQDGALSNLSPVLVGWVAVAVDPVRAIGPEAHTTVALWLVAHMLASWLLAAILVRSRKRLGAHRFKRRALVCAALLACGGALFVHVLWPDKIFFDASVIYYDVSDLIEPAPGAHFPNAEAAAACIRGRTADSGPHFIPDTVVGAADEPTIIAWGSWPEHARLRRELTRLREE